MWTSAVSSMGSQTPPCPPCEIGPRIARFGARFSSKLTSTSPPAWVGSCQTRAEQSTLGEWHGGEEATDHFGSGGLGWTNEEVSRVHEVYERVGLLQQAQALQRRLLHEGTHFRKTRA